MISSLPLVCIHLFFFINVSYIRGFVSQSHMHVIYVSKKSPPPRCILVQVFFSFFGGGGVTFNKNPQTQVQTQYNTSSSSVDLLCALPIHIPFLMVGSCWEFSCPILILEIANHKDCHSSFKIIYEKDKTPYKTMIRVIFFLQ